MSRLDCASPVCGRVRLSQPFVFFVLLALALAPVFSPSSSPSLSRRAFHGAAAVRLDASSSSASASPRSSVARDSSAAAENAQSCTEPSSAASPLKPEEASSPALPSLREAEELLREEQALAAEHAQRAASEAEQFAEAAREAAAKGDVAAAQELATAAANAAAEAQDIAAYAQAVADTDAAALVERAREEAERKKQAEQAAASADAAAEEPVAQGVEALFGIGPEAIESVPEALEKLEELENAVEETGRQMEERELAVSEYVNAAQEAALRHEEASRAFEDATKNKKENLAAAAEKEAVEAAEEYEELVAAAELLTQEAAEESARALATAVAAGDLRYAINQRVVSEAGSDARGKVPRVLLAPKHFQIADPGNKRVLKIYFHNNFAPFEDLPCAALHADALLCRQHPRCVVQYEQSGDELLQRCILDDAYLSLVAKTTDFCSPVPEEAVQTPAAASPLNPATSLEPMAAVTEGEVEAVALDLLQELGIDGPAALEQMAAEGRGSSSHMCNLVQSLSEELLRTERDPRCGTSKTSVGGENIALTTEALLASNFGFLGPAPVPSATPAAASTPAAARSASIRSHNRTAYASSAASGKTLEVPQVSPTGLFGLLGGSGASSKANAPIRMGINGMGRIGRLVFRIAMSRPNVTVTHINCSMDPAYIAYMLKYDSVHGRFDGNIEATADGLIVNGQEISVSNTRNPSEIPWADKGVDYVCESTGAFCTTEDALKHVSRPGGAKHAVISAPAKDETTPTLVVGVNAEQEYESSMKVVSCASCTTNGLAPLVKVIDDNFGLVEGLMTTVHAATGTQKVVDGTSKKDWRGGRSSGANIIPSSTGAAKAVARCLPHMKGRLTGMAFRVPTLDVSVVDLTCRLNKSATYEDIKKAVREASETYMRGIIGYTEEPIVSQDIVGSQCSTVFDANAGIMLNPNFVKLVSWYDNEYAYSARLVDLIAVMAAKDGVVAEGTGLDRKPF